MIAITTSNSISVKPRGLRRDMESPSWKADEDERPASRRTPKPERAGEQGKSDRLTLMRQYTGVNREIGIEAPVGKPASGLGTMRPMFAGQISRRGQIELIDVSEPAWPPAGDDGPSILFRPELACLCGSDLPYFEQAEARYPPGIGHSLHEIVGTVLATTGSRFRAGDRVLAVPVDQRGLFERFVVAETRAIPLTPGVPDERLVVAQPLGTVLYALRRMPPVAGLSVAVVGQGPIGQLFNMALRERGATTILGIDRDPQRLRRSRELGATAVICTAETDPVEAVRSHTSGRLADVVIEAVGHADHALDLCIDLVRREGRLLVFGVPPAVVDGFRWRELFINNITVQTSVNPDFTIDFPAAMSWIADGRVDVSGLLTHRFPLSDVQTAFETFRDHRDGALKVLIEFPAWKEPA
jgi:threonine dehydrogenase-like Zn-dependent dehydrogenase